MKIYIPTDLEGISGILTFKSLSKWEVVSGDWKVEAGTLKGVSTPNSLILAGNERWSDYSFSVTSKVIKSTIPGIDYVKLFLFFRVEDKENYYQLGIYGGQLNKAFHLEKVVEGKVTNLGYLRFDNPNLNHDIEMEKWYTLKVEVKGNSLKAYLNNKLIIQAEDDTFPIGKIGLGADEGMIALYKDVKVEKIEGGGIKAVVKPLSFRLIQRNLINKDIIIKLKANRLLNLKPQELKAKIDIVSLEERKLIETKLIKGFKENYRLEIRFDTSLFPVGEYRADVQLLNKEEKILSSQSSKFQLLSKPKWLNSQAGITEKVLSPWTPIEIKGKTVSCWGRIYDFSQSLFPVRIETANKSILFSPISLNCKLNGKDISYKKCRSSVRSKSKAKVILQSSAESDGIEFRTNSLIEYDGMIKIDLILSPKKKITVDNLILRIPLKKEYATLYHFWPQGEGKDELLQSITQNSGALPENGMQLPFKPFVWLGNEEGGLSWFSESDKGWNNENSKKAITITPTSEKIILNIILIDKPIQIDSSLEYTFGLQATPVKPFPENWREWKICHGAYYGMEKGKPSILKKLKDMGVGTIVYHENWSDILNYSDTPYREELKNLVSETHKLGMKILLYFGYTLSDIAPEWGPYHEELLLKEPEADPGIRPIISWENDLPPQNYIGVCYNGPWQDFLASGVKHVMEKYKIDGVYLDGTSEPFACSNYLHGCAYKDKDSAIRYTYPIFARRNLMKRLYNICAKKGGLVDVHQSSCMVMPALSFATSYWDGEHLSEGTIQHAITKAKKQSAFLEVLPLATFRAEFMGRNWGIPSQFLAYATGETCSGDRWGADMWSYDTALTVTLLHDVVIRPFISELKKETSLVDSLWIKKVCRIWQVMEEFGVSSKDCHWYPYWRNREFIKSKPEGVEISIFSRRGKALAIVSNLTDDIKNAELLFDVSHLGLKGISQVKDVMNGKLLPIAKKGRIKTAINAFRWKMLLIK